MEKVKHLAANEETKTEQKGEYILYYIYSLFGQKLNTEGMLMFAGPLMTIRK